MLHSHTALTDTMLEQVENHRSGPKIQGQHFSVVNKITITHCHTQTDTEAYIQLVNQHHQRILHQGKTGFMPAAEEKETFENPSNSKITSISLNLTAIPLSKLYL